MRRLMSIVTMLIIIGVGVAGYYYYGEPQERGDQPGNEQPVVTAKAASQKEAVDGLLSALRKKQYRQAYEFTSTDFKRSASLAEFIRFARHYDALIRNEKFLVTSTKEDGSSGKLEGVLVQGAHQAETSSYNFDKKRGRCIPKDDAKGIIRGLLTQATGRKSKVFFSLVNEGAEGWRVDNIDIKPLQVKSDNSINKLILAMQKKKKLDLSEKFDNVTSLYEINYPDNWSYKQINPGAVVFTGKPGSRSYFSTINVQTILTKQSGGNFETVEELVASIKNKVEESSRDVNIINEGPIDIKAKGGEEMRGYFVKLTYYYSGREYQQWQVVVKRDDDRAFYTWAFTSPKRTYVFDLPVAEEMFKTWKIY